MRFTELGRPKRATWLRGRGEADAPVQAVVGADGIDFDPNRAHRLPSEPIASDATPGGTWPWRSWEAS